MAIKKGFEAFMCGIAGYFGFPGRSESRSALLRKMISAISHRGPDQTGIHAGRGAGLAHARLIIIDLATGMQPMSNDDRTVWLAFNGEIFNYIELRRDLVARGHVFRTQSDTEVVLRLYEEKGADCVDDLNGDFAFAIWDGRRGRLMLARDRMGVRPLYYAERGGCLYFASEIKALLEAPDIDAVPDPVAFDQILTFWFPLAPRTPFKDIAELPPGHVLIAGEGHVAVRSYWRLDYPDAAEAGEWDGRGEDDIAEELRALLIDATRIRLRSDVPVGAYLSGGLDSSIIAAAVKRIVPDRLKTFSVTFESDEFDESAFQRDMVRALNTEHADIRCRAADIGRLFPAVIRHTERPILRTAPAPLFALSDLAHRSGFKVVLTGEGADEVFAGYDIFKEAKLRRFCARQPESRLRPLLFRRLYPYLPQLQSQSHGYVSAFFTAGGAEPDDPLFSHLPRFRTTAGTKLFLSDAIRQQLGDYDALAELRDGLPAEFGHWHPLSQAQYLEAAHLLPGYILSSQGDRMSMAHSLEGRYPFLDHRLVEFAARIPPKLKIRGLREKHVLRESMKDLLPAGIGERTKQPYRAPDSQCFLGPDAPDYLHDVLSVGAIDAAGIFDADAVDRFLSKCRRKSALGTRDNMALVGIVSTQLWHRAFVERDRQMESGVAPRAVA